MIILWLYKMSSLGVNLHEVWEIFVVFFPISIFLKWFQNAFIHCILLGSYDMPGTVLGPGNRVVTKLTKIRALVKLLFFRGNQ